ncbi:MAG: iron hydrogenase small subunit [Spirochaetes bacterium]|nr:iron hydrogenase small subunit [Spirochaetota bacterium]
MPIKSETITIKINDKKIKVPKGTSIYKAAALSQIKIPSLCYHPDLKANAACGLCIVKIKGMNKVVRSCATEAQEGMEIITHDKELYETRKTVIELILSNHPDDCLFCQRNQNCELQRLASEFGVRESRFNKRLKEIQKDISTTSLIIDPQKCVNCGRCVEVCQNVQDVWAVEFIGRGFDMSIAPAGNLKLNNSPCIKCGQCSAHCPVGAIVEKDEVETVISALMDKNLYPVAQIAPAVRVSFGEAFKFDSGDVITKKLYALLRKIGFKAVFDTNFSADLTIMEEANEFVRRFKKNPESLPLVTSCCPAWVDYLEKYFPDMIDHFSTAKSPHEMMGVLSKTYFPKIKKIDPSRIFMVSIMPCTAKKYEITRSDEMFASGYQDIDVVLTTRELVRMTKSAGIDFDNIEEEESDLILGSYTGAGTIFGATGGVMEAALRTAYNLLTGEDLPNVDFKDVRGLEGIKEAEIDINGTKIKVAIAHGIGNVKDVLERVKIAKINNHEIPWHFIEVMACRGGCVGGGGQPYGVTDEVRKKRTDGIYTDDKKQVFRCSHQNPYIVKLYEDFLGEPNSKKAHQLLHTKYKARPLYMK